MNGAEVKWILDADSGRFDAAMDSASKKTKNLEKDIKQVDSNVSSFGSNLGSAFGGIASGLGGLLSAFTKVGLVGSIGFGAATVAAFNQVKQVQNASFALKAYETDASKVNAVLSELVGYARSDLGVLFQRQDLFDAASTLKIYGVETNKLVGYTKILSKGVAIGKTTFQELSEVLGRVVTEGKLTSDSFDVLARRGIKLPSTMRNTAVSAEELFQALDKSLPDSLLEGRANTIDGAFIRLQSSFRDLGSAILGVDADTSTFIKGGLGDQFVKSLESVRQVLKDPVFKKALADLGASVGDFATKAIPALLNGAKFIAQNFSTIVAVFASVVAMFIAAKIAAIGFAIAAAIAGAPIYLIAAAIILLVGILTFLELKFGVITKVIDFFKVRLQSLINIFKLIATGDFKGGILGLSEDSPAIKFFLKLHEVGKAVYDFISTQLKASFESLKSIGSQLGTALKPVVDIVGGIFKSIADTAKPVLESIGNFFKDNKDTILTVLKVIGAALLIVFAGPTLVAIGLFLGALKVISVVLKFVADHFDTIKSVVIAVITVALLPLIVAFNVIKTVVTIIVGAFNLLVSVFNFLKPGIMFVINILTTLFSIFLKIEAFIALVIVGTLTMIATFIFNIFSTIVGYISTALNFIGGIISTIFNFYFTVISTVLGFIWGIITTVWNAISGTISTVLSTIWGFIMSVWNTIYGFLSGIVSSIYNRLVNGFRNIYDGVVSVMSTLWGYISGIGGTIISKIGNFASVLYNKGRDLIQGLIDGAGSLLSKLATFFLDKVPGPLKGAFKKALGINSPSKVFASYGQNIVQGLTNGIATNASKAINVADDLSSKIVDTLSGDASYGVGINGMSIPANSGANNLNSSSQASQGSLNNINVVNNNYSVYDQQKALSDLGWMLR